MKEILENPNPEINPFDCLPKEKFKSLPIRESRPLKRKQIGNKYLLIAVKGAFAALNQNKTFPADIKLAKLILSDAIQKAGSE